MPRRDEDPPPRPYEPTRGPMAWSRPATDDDPGTGTTERRGGWLGPLILLIGTLSVLAVVAVILLR
jgi:hypothetical protein